MKWQNKQANLLLTWLLVTNGTFIPIVSKNITSIIHFKKVIVNGTVESQISVITKDVNEGDFIIISLKCKNTITKCMFFKK